MKVLWVVKGLGHGGAETLTIDIVRALKARGIEVVVLSVGADTSGRQRIEDAEIRLIQQPSGCVRGGWLRSILRAERPDVVHVQNPLPSARFAVLRALARFHHTAPWRLVVTEHAQFTLYHPLTRAAVRATSWRRDATVLVSEAAQLPRFAQQGEVIVHSPSATCQLERSVARDQLSLRADSFVVAQVAGFRPPKEQEQLILAAEWARARVEHLQVILIGDGPDRPAAKQLVEQRGLSDVVLLPGAVPHASRFFRAFDALAVVSRSEGAPISIMEGMHAGLPIVASDVGGVRALLQLGHGQPCGQLLGENDPATIGHAMVRLALDEGFRRQQAALSGERGRQLTLESTVDALVDVYARVLHRPVRHGAPDARSSSYDRGGRER